MVPTPSEADRPASAIHSTPANLLLLFPSALFTSSPALSEVSDEVGEGSATFLKVKVQMKSSPEKNAVSGNEGKTFMLDGRPVIAAEAGVLFSEPAALAL